MISTFKKKVVDQFNVREFAKEQGVAEEKALAVGMAEKAKKFVATGGGIYQGTLPEGARKYE